MPQASATPAANPLALVSRSAGGWADREADALLNISGAFKAARPNLRQSLSVIEAEIAHSATWTDCFERECAFERAARSLRKVWLQDAAAEAARVFRSPTDEERHELSENAYGYERDLQPDVLEQRCHRLFGAAPNPWTATHVLFSSGQAALASLFVGLRQVLRADLRVFHAGAYFETEDLIERMACPTPRLADANCAVVEPIACNGSFTAHDASAIAASIRPGCLVVDETLSAPASQMHDVLRAAAGRDLIVTRVISALKLFQQGLELANVGIVSVYCEGSPKSLQLAQALKRCRTLMGGGLRLTDSLALQASFFLEKEATAAYAAELFDHNARLDRAIAMTGDQFFAPLDASARSVPNKPYSVFRLRQSNGVDGLEKLAQRIDSEAHSRRLLFARGGSFGFRGHRYDIIRPEGKAKPFLRVALGSRGGENLAGVIQLFADLAMGI